MEVMNRRERRALAAQGLLPDIDETLCEVWDLPIFHISISRNKGSEVILALSPRRWCDLQAAFAIEFANGLRIQDRLSELANYLQIPAALKFEFDNRVACNEEMSRAPEMSASATKARYRSHATCPGSGTTTKTNAAAESQEFDPSLQGDRRPRCGDRLRRRCQQNFENGEKSPENGGGGQPPRQEVEATYSYHDVRAK